MTRVGPLPYLLGLVGLIRLLEAVAPDLGVMAPSPTVTLYSTAIVFVAKDDLILIRYLWHRGKKAAKLESQKDR